MLRISGTFGTPPYKTFSVYKILCGHRTLASTNSRPHLHRVVPLPPKAAEIPLIPERKTMMNNDVPSNNDELSPASSVNLENAPAFPLQQLVPYRVRQQPSEQRGVCPRCCNHQQRVGIEVAEQADENAILKALGILNDEELRQVDERIRFTERVCRKVRTNAIKTFIAKDKWDRAQERVRRARLVVESLQRLM